MQKVKEGSRWEKQYEKTTLVRVSSDTHNRIKNLIRPGESIQDVISRAISLLETGNTLLPDIDVSVNGAINVDVNDIVNTVIERVNADINNKLTQINERLDNLIPGIEHQRDETGHTLEMVFSIQKRLEALEAQRVHSVDDKPDEPINPHIVGDMVIFDEPDNRVYKQVSNRIQELKSVYTYHQIMTTLGMGKDKESMLKKFKNGEYVKTLSVDDYNKIMNRSSPEKSSPEGT